MTSKSTFFRRKQKEEQPERYALYLEKQKARFKARQAAEKLKPMTRERELLLEAKKQRQRENQAAYYARKKGQPVNHYRSRPDGTKRPRDMTHEEKKEHTRRLRAESRARMSAQKKRRIKEKARDYMRQKRAQMKAGKTIAPEPATPVSLPSEPQILIAAPALPQPSTSQEPSPLLDSASPLGLSSPSVNSLSPAPKYKKKTLYNLTSMVKKLLRRPTPKESAKVLETLIKARTPEFKAAIKKRGFVRSPTKPKARRSLMKSLSPKAKKQSLVRRVTSRLLKKARQRSSQKFDEVVRDFYLRSDVSRVLPHQRYTTKHGTGHIMNLTIRGAWRQFVHEYQAKIGYTKFSKLRPKNVRKLGSVAAETCLCIYCLNIKYKLDALNRLLGPQKIAPLPSESQMLNLICCATEEKLPKADCVFGKCKKCKDSIRAVREKTMTIEDQQVTWTRWMRGETTKKLDVFVRSGTVRDLLLCLESDIDKMSKTSTFREHLFTAHWQYKAAHDLKVTLREGEAMMIMDFAENRKACYNAEVKSAHFGKSQMTLHPVVVYWKNSKCQLVRHVLMYLSDDIRHDYHAVQCFTAHAVEYVKRLIQLRRLVIFSDGCASQYKGRGTFADLSLMRCGVAVERCYYGSEHGKGEADGETGVLSQMLKRAVEGGQVNIRDASDLFSWATQTMAKDGELEARKFFLINYIERDRPETLVGTLSGTRGFHQVQRVADYKLRCRRLSCFCCACRANAHIFCMHQDYLGPWTTHTLKRTNTATPDETTATEEETTVAETTDAETTATEETTVAETTDAETTATEETTATDVETTATNNEMTDVLNEAFLEEAVDTGHDNIPVLPSVGSFVEVTHRTLRGDLKTFKCLVVPSELTSKEGDIAVQYLKASVGPNQFILNSEMDYIINLGDTNVASIKVLPTPAITARGHYVF